MTELVNTIVYPPGVRDLSEDISTDDLVRRLKECAQAFQSMAQEEENANQYEPLAHLLVSERFLEHKSSDVRLLVACCIADIFRVSAPEAPYRDEYEITVLLEFFIDQLAGLSNQKHPAFRRYFYLLENLSVVKTFNICFDLQDAHAIMCSLFKQMFKIIKNNQILKLPRIIADLLCPLINEADLVPVELINIILNHIIEPKKSENKNACMLAQDILQKTASALSTYLQGYFTKEFYMGEQCVTKRLCDLIYELNTINQSMMSFVIPQLEGKLKSSDEEERLMITSLVARMFSAKKSNMIYENKSLWSSYLARSCDVSLKVRILTVHSSKNFLFNQPQSRTDITDLLTQRSRDMDETVRYEVILTILSIAAEDIFCLDENIIAILTERSLDKMFRIRKECLLGIAQLYKQYILDSDYVDPYIEKLLRFVKTKIFHAYYQSALSDKFLVERILHTCLVPFQRPVKERMKLLYQLYCTIDNYATKAFKEILRSKKAMRLLTIGLLEIIQHNRPGKKELLQSKICSIAKSLPGLRKSAESMSKFCKDMENHVKLRSLMAHLLSGSISCAQAEVKVRQILRYLGSIGASGQLYSAAIKQLLERIVPVLLDKEGVKYLVSIAKDSIVGDKTIEAELKLENSGQRGLDLLNVLASTYPYYFIDEEIFQSFVQILRVDDPEMAQVTLETLSFISRDLENVYPLVYSELLPVVTNFMESGTPKQAKYATQTALKMVANKDNVFGRIIKHLHDQFTFESKSYRSALVSSGFISILCPDLFSDYFKTSVGQEVVKRLLMIDRTPHRFGGDMWGPLESLPLETKVKIEGMKLMVRWLLGVKDLRTPAGSTFKLCNLILQNDGDLMQNKYLAPKEMSWMRYTAARSVLKLCYEPNYAFIFDVSFFVRVAYVMNDKCPEVREKFAAKVHKGLFYMKLPVEFLAILPLGVLVPNKQFRLTIKQYLLQNIAKRKEHVNENNISPDELPYQWPDYSLPIVVYLLAHAPFFEAYDHVPSLLKIKDVLYIFIEALLYKRESYSFAFFKRLLENIKQTKDKLYADKKEYNLKLYAVCDLALNILMIERKLLWNDFPGQPKLNSKFFTEPDKNYSNLVTYLPPQLLNTNKLVESGFEIEVFDKTKDKNLSNNVSGDSIPSTSRDSNPALEIAKLLLHPFSREAVTTASTNSNSSVPQSNSTTHSTNTAKNDTERSESALSNTSNRSKLSSQIHTTNGDASEREKQKANNSDSAANLKDKAINHSKTISYQSDTEFCKTTSSLESTIKKGRSKKKPVIKRKPLPKQSVTNRKNTKLPHIIKDSALPSLPSKYSKQDGILLSSPSSTIVSSRYTSDYEHLIKPCSVYIKRLEQFPSDVFNINENGSYSFKRKHDFVDSEDRSSRQGSSAGSHLTEEIPRKRGRPPKKNGKLNQELSLQPLNKKKSLSTSTSSIQSSRSRNRTVVSSSSNSSPAKSTVKNGRLPKEKKPLVKSKLNTNHSSNSRKSNAIAKKREEVNDEIKKVQTTLTKTVKSKQAKGQQNKKTEGKNGGRRR